MRNRVPALVVRHSAKQSDRNMGFQSENKKKTEAACQYSSVDRQVVQSS